MQRLNNTKYRYLIYLFVFAVLGLQVYLLSTLNLFGDEAFYWLEAQHLALSYAELPGWTAWMIRFGVNLFGNHYYAVRLPSYLAFLSIFYAIYLFHNKKRIFTHLLLVTAIPLFMLIAIMALPDIWILFFVVWMTYFFKQAIKNNKTSNWLILGILMALSINVHVRMWIWLFISGCCFLYFYYQNKKVLQSLLFISLPIGLLGLIPLIIFNVNNEFALLAFQFSNRHPWTFQISNLSFILSQFVVITPLLLVFWFSVIFRLKSQNKFLSWLILTAFIHWVLYALLSLFADGLRTTVHWVVVSYVPVFAFVLLSMKQTKRLEFWAIITGNIITLVMFVIVSFRTNIPSNMQDRILDNSSGWKTLAANVKRIASQHQIKNIIADYFMTASELAFELNLANDIKVLSHAKNIKHGRQKQLQLMGLLLEKPEQYNKDALLVVEDSTLKLKDKGQYYQKLCQDFKNLKLLETITIKQSKKQFHVFKLNGNSTCKIPPLFYIDHRIKNNKIIISGWTVLDQVGVKSLTLLSGDQSYIIKNNNISNVGIHNQFPEINDPNQPNNGFSIELDLNKISHHQLRIEAISNNNQSHLSQIYYIN